MDADNDILFLILTSHGSRACLAVKAGRLTQTPTPSNLAYMLARTGMRYKVVVISACYSGSLWQAAKTCSRCSLRVLERPAAFAADACLPKTASVLI